MQLNYRGLAYSAAPADMTTMATETSRLFLGVRYRMKTAHAAQGQPMPTPLQYRGISSSR